MTTKEDRIILFVDVRPEKPFSIRKKNYNEWLCANTHNPENWHYANNQGCTGVTSFYSFEDAKKVCDTLINHEVVEFK